mgnify:CR=1 FL=1
MTLDDIKQILDMMREHELTELELELADFKVLDEGEITLPLFIEAIERGEAGGRFSANGDKPDVTATPVPRFDLLDPEKYNRITVQTSRGCPHRCEFCASSVLLTPRYKLKPVEKVLGEIHAIKRLWSRPFIEFADDNSFVHVDHYKRLLRALVPEGLRWFTEADVRVAEDDELLGLMRDSGCQQVLIGLESPRGSSLGGLELKADWKHRQRDRYLDAIAKIQSRGITVNGCFILGLDGDGPEVFDEVFQFVQSSGLYEVQVTLLTPFPGTPLYERLLAEGRLLQPEAWELFASGLLQAEALLRRVSGSQLIVHLKQGDTLVQRGTIHDWVNNGTKPCVIAFVLVAAKPVHDALG